MVDTPDPQPRLNLLKAGTYSPMRFMQEHLVYDKEVDSLVRFLGPFEMPDWTGVEENESDYLIEESWMRLDIIAKEKYGTDRHELQWVIAARNNLDLPDAQLLKGKVLKIPDKEWVDNKLLTQSLNMKKRQ
jgi:hypothetical protein